MSYSIDTKCTFKMDITHVFDAVDSYLIKEKGKVQNKHIRIYTAYNTSTGSMGHLSIVQSGRLKLSN